MQANTQIAQDQLSVIRKEVAQIGAGTDRLEVTLTNIRNARGKLMIAVYDTANGFPESFDAAHLRIMIPAKPGKQTVSIIGLQNKDYALTVFHDENENGVLDKNALGMPLEGYGVSNNARNRFRAPDWTKAKFRMRDGKKLFVKLAYPVL